MISVRELAESGVTVIEPGPRLTLENAHELLKVVQTIPATIAPSIIVNMEQTSIVDSSGVGALVTAMRHLRKVNGGFALVGLRPEILRSFRLMNLHQVFDIYETETLARQQLSERRP
jgi:anti-sigma B factor antagonist